MKDSLADIAPDPCCDGMTGARPLIPVATAIERATALAETLTGTETLPLFDAIGRVLAHDLESPIPLPPFDNSAMDGYALRSADLGGPGPWRLRVSGRVAAGDDAAASGHVTPGTAFRIFTGAGIPPGADAVVMQEHVERTRDHIVLRAAVKAGDCIRPLGEDAAKGARLLEAGTMIGAREIGAIASVGLPRIEVRRRLKVALFCTGSELRQPGQTLASGQIYNSNRYMMHAALRAPWIELNDLGSVADEPARLRDMLVRAADSADMIITTGGVSVGEEDHMVPQLRAAGGQIEVMKIAMKPGKPLSIGRLGRAIFVGLPGNPVAAFTTWRIIGSRIAERLVGQKAGTATPTEVEAAASFSRRPGRQEFRPARIIGAGRQGRPRVQLLDQSFSAKVSLICKADGLAVIPAESTRVEKGQRLDFVPL